MHAYIKCDTIVHVQHAGHSYACPCFSFSLDHAWLRPPCNFIFHLLSSSLSPCCVRARLFAREQVHEAVRCHSKCSQYEWRSDSWSICTINAVDDLPACGEGVQSRKIR